MAVNCHGRARAVVSDLMGTPAEAEALAPIRSIPALESKAAAKKHGQIPSLDGLRAVAFLIVFISHAGWQSVIPGGFGVTIFFFLSGFLITTLLREEIARHGEIDFRRFYARRVLRIWPPFYLVLALATVAALGGLLAMQLNRPAMLALIFHFTNYRSIAAGVEGMPPGTGVYWSLAVEEHFYLVFPLLLTGIHRWRLSAKNQATLLWGICVAVLAWRTVLVLGMGSPPIRTYMGSDTRIDSLLFGCALALYGNPSKDSSRFQDQTWKFVLLPLGVACLLLTFVIRSDAFRETIRYSLQGVALVPVFVTAIRFPEWGAGRILNWSWVRGIGVLSYSLYLIHLCALHAFQEGLGFPKVTGAVLALIATLFLSLGIYLLIERPLAAVRRRLSR
ncbi:MAG: acyltransferase [Gemmatimonadota bacterium]